MEVMVRDKESYKNVPEHLTEAFNSRFSDSTGNPTETYNWIQYGLVMNERRTEQGYPYLNPIRSTFNERIETETKVREALYGDSMCRLSEWEP